MLSPGPLESATQRRRWRAASALESGRREIGRGSAQLPIFLGDPCRHICISTSTRLARTHDQYSQIYLLLRIRRAGLHRSCSRRTRLHCPASHSSSPLTRAPRPRRANCVIGANAKAHFSPRATTIPTHPSLASRLSQNHLAASSSLRASLIGRVSNRRLHHHVLQFQATPFRAPNSIKTSLPTRLQFRFCSLRRLPFQATSSLSTSFSIFSATPSFAVIVGAGVSFVTTHGRAKAYLLPFDSVSARLHLAACAHALQPCHLDLSQPSMVAHAYIRQ